MKKILMVLGTRPEAIKMAPVYLELCNYHESIDVKLCSTGQHIEMLNQALQMFDIKVDFELNLMIPKQSLSHLTSSLMSAVSNLLKDWTPDFVLVHGDTTTAMITALACFYQGIEVGHVEAGLRTNNLKSPFPEELNRQLISKIASVHFAPTENAKTNLISEGVSKDRIYLTGNTIVDSLMLIMQESSKKRFSREEAVAQISRLLGFDIEIISYVLITAHRRENFGEGIQNICEAILQLSRKFEEVMFVYAVHLNPNVLDPVNQILGKQNNVFLIPPQSYLYFLMLLRGAKVVITDSGGVQEEAPSFGVPVILLRNETERPEAIQSSISRMVGPNVQEIIDATTKILVDNKVRSLDNLLLNPFGDGQAASRISKIVVDRLLHNN